MLTLIRLCGIIVSAMGKRGRPKKQAHERQTETVAIRLSPLEKHELSELAARESRSFSAQLRHLLREAVRADQHAETNQL